jgi:biotin operon repressor
VTLTACTDQLPDDQEEFTFGVDDLENFTETVDSGATLSVPSGSGETIVLDPMPMAGTGDIIPTLNLSDVGAYRAIRSGASMTGDQLFRVTNEFLNVRGQPSVTANSVDRLVRGDVLTVLEFIDGMWAKVRTQGGKEGYVAHRYIAKLVSEDQLAAEKKKYEGQYFVDFTFVNVRKDANAQSEKLGELPGQSIVRPLNMDQNWARIMFQGREGYVASQYLTPFLPAMLVRQESFTMPVFLYSLADAGAADRIVEHVARLKQDGVKVMTFRDFRDLLMAQEQRDVRLDPHTVLLGVTGVTAQTTGSLDTLTKAGVRATLFIETRDLGITGITEKAVLTLQANGFDIQSATHTGDDLRSLTNAQIDLELSQSRQLLEQLTRQSIFAIAYPQGGVNDRVMEEAAAAGYLLGVSAVPDRTFTREQLLRLPSYTVTTGMSVDDIARVARGN